MKILTNFSQSQQMVFKKRKSFIKVNQTLSPDLESKTHVNKFYGKVYNMKLIDFLSPIELILSTVTQNLLFCCIEP